MASLLKLCEEQFGSKNLYEVLGVKEEASNNECKFLCLPSSVTREVYCLPRHQLIFSFW